MKIVQILHHSISPLMGQYSGGDPLHYNSGFPMQYARAIRLRYPYIELECWRPDCAVQQVYTWHDESVNVTHRVFPSMYGRYNLEYSHSMLVMARRESRDKDTFFLIHGSYNLHAYLLALILGRGQSILQSHGGFPGTVLFKLSGRRWLRYGLLIYAVLERLTLPKFRHILAISKEEYGYLKQLCPSSYIHLSPTGIDFELFSPGDRQTARSICNLPSEQTVLLSVGRLSPEKGLEYLLNALAQIRGKIELMPRLIIIGNGPMHNSLVRQTNELGIDQFVDFIGSVPNNKLPHWYRAADITVLPSVLEWFGAVAVESLACGTPIIGTHAGGLVDIVEQFGCGFLVPPRDISALADAILNAINWSSDCEPKISYGYTAFDWSVKISRLMTVYCDMAQ